MEEYVLGSWDFILYSFTINKGAFGEKLSLLYTCGICDSVVELYDCIQLFNYYGYDGGQHETVQRNE